MDPVLGSAAAATAAQLKGCRRVPMTAKDGSKQCCAIATPECTGRRGGGPGPLSTADEAGAFGLLDALSGVCMYMQEGLWTYEVCYRKHTRQFRQDNAGHGEDFSCGRYTGDDVQDRKVKEDTSSHPHPIRYVSHVFSNGEKCALTASPRTAEVRFTCLPDLTDNSIVTVKEFPTCNYVFLVHTPVLCGHPDFRLPPREAFVLRCEPAPEGGCPGEEEEEEEEGGEGEEEGEDDSKALLPTEEL